MANGTVYIGGDTTLYAVDAATGEQEWAFTQPTGPVDSSPTVYEETVYVGSFTGMLYAVDAAMGSQEWAFTQPSGIINSSPTVVDGTVYVGSVDETLYAVDVGTGSQEWAFTQPTDGVQSSPTVVADPQSGDSIGSRVLLGTLGHHGSRADRVTTSSPALFTVTIEEPTETLAGDSLNMTVAVENTGDASGTQEVSLSVPGLGSDSMEVSLDGDSSTTETLSLSTDEGDAGEYTVTASAGDSKITETVTVSEPAGDDSTGSPDGGSTSGDDQSTTGAPGNGGSPEGDDGGLGTVEMAAVGGGGGLALLLGAYALMRRVGDDSDSTSESTDTSTGGGSPDRPSPSSSPSSSPNRDANRQRGRSDARGVPSTIPDTPCPSLTYEDITVGDTLGRGGNADVYYATATTPQGKLELAIKEPRMGGGETLQTDVVERMMTEADTWQQLDGHDHVAGVVDYDTHPLPWIAVEYMDGGHLGERAGEMGTAQKLWTALSVTEGVYHAHNRGIAHRDLKPENILFRRVDGA